jgi:hypothetical protein
MSPFEIVGAAAGGQDEQAAAKCEPGWFISVLADLGGEQQAASSALRFMRCYLSCYELELLQQRQQAAEGDSLCTVSSAYGAAGAAKHSRDSSLCGVVQQCSRNSKLHEAVVAYISYASSMFEGAQAAGNVAAVVHSAESVAAHTAQHLVNTPLRLQDGSASSTSCTNCQSTNCQSSHQQFPCMTSQHC